MKVHKIGHCCLQIDIGGTRILTDPGGFSVEGHNGVTDIDVILITHEHADHLHTDSLKQIMENNPSATVVTNTAVGAILTAEGIEHRVVDGDETATFAGILFEAFDAKHAEIFEDAGQVQNTGYLIDSTLFYPGDAWADPKRPVPVLALPVAGPWCRIADAIRYALHIKPRTAFPVHDGMLQEDRVGANHRIPGKVLKENDIRFVPMLGGDSCEF